MKKIVLYGQILLIALMVQRINADPEVNNPFKVSTVAESYDIDQLTNQIDFFHQPTPVFVPTMDQAKGLFDNGLMSRRELRHWILMMEPRTSSEKTTYNKLYSMFIPATDSAGAAKKRAELKTKKAVEKIKQARDKRDEAELARAQHNEVLAREKRANFLVKKSAKTEKSLNAKSQADAVQMKSKNERLAKKKKRTDE